MQERQPVPLYAHGSQTADLVTENRDDLKFLGVSVLHYPSPNFATHISCDTRQFPTASTTDCYLLCVLL